MKYLPLFAATLLSVAALPAFSQEPVPPPAGERARTATAKADADVSYGRIKELTPAQKVVIDVDNYPDKTFDLTDKDVAVKIGKGLKVGDPVKVTEHDSKGKKTVMIALHKDSSVKHGDKTSTGEKNK
jgi:hypothetical protein